MWLFDGQHDLRCFRRRLSSLVWLGLCAIATSVSVAADDALAPLVTDVPPPPLLDVLDESEAALEAKPVDLPPDQDAGLINELDELRKRLEVLESRPAPSVAPAAAKPSNGPAKPTINWTGQFQTDAVWFNQSPESIESFGDIENGTAFRRARLAMLGEYGPTEYRIEMDYALPGRPSFLDVYAGVKNIPGWGRIRVGHFFEPFTLERMTPNRFVLFLERSLVDHAFVPARNTGIMANNTWGEDSQGTWAAGIFRSDSDNFGDDVGDNFEFDGTSRLTWLPYYEDNGQSYMHLGAAYSFRGANNELVRFRSQPEIRLGSATPNVPFFVDTGQIPADYYQLFGIEAALVHHSFLLQSEAVASVVDSKNSGDLTFYGWFGMMSWLITGEYHPYNKSLGLFDRVIPLRDAVRYTPEEGFSKGPGAWELALRVSHVQLNSGDVRGGVLTDLTAGLNWYMNPYMRVTANYIHAFADSQGIDSGTDIWGLRFGYEF